MLTVESEIVESEILEGSELGVCSADMVHACDLQRFSDARGISNWSCGWLGVR